MTDFLSPGGLNLNRGPRSHVRLLFDLVAVQFPWADETGDLISSPWPNDAQELSRVFPEIEDKLTTDARRVISVRIHAAETHTCNLAAMPGLTPEAAGDFSASCGTSGIATLTQLMGQGHAELELLREVGPYLNLGGDMLQTHVIGGFEDGGFVCRREVITDSTRIRHTSCFGRISFLSEPCVHAKCCDSIEMESIQSTSKSLNTSRRRQFTHLPYSIHCEWLAWLVSWDGMTTIAGAFAVEDMLPWGRSETSAIPDISKPSKAGPGCRTGPRKPSIDATTSRCKRDVPVLKQPAVTSSRGRTHFPTAIPTMMKWLGPAFDVVAAGLQRDLELRFAIDIRQKQDYGERKPTNEQLLHPIRE